MFLSQQLWEEMLPFLRYNCKMKDTKKNFDVLFSRVKKVIDYFSNVEFTPYNFTLFLQECEEVYHYEKSYQNNFIKTVILMDKFFAHRNPAYKRQFEGMIFFKERHDIPKNTLTLEEMRKMIDVKMRYRRYQEFYEKRDKAIVALFVETPGRYSEVMGLKWDDVYDDSGEHCVMFRDTKNGDDRENVIVKEEVWEMIQAVPKLEGCEYVFPSINGKMLDNPQTNTLLKDRAKAAGITKPVTAQLFRHSWGKIAGQSDMGLFDRQRIMGHKDPRVTARYANVDRRQMAQAMMLHPFNKSAMEFDKMQDMVRTKIKNMVEHSPASFELLEDNGEETIIRIKRKSI